MAVNALERVQYSTRDFMYIRALMLKHAGISLHDGKKELVYSWLAKRVRCLSLSSFEEYCNLIAVDETELLHCINAMTTNVTSFFRENHHFEFLAGNILPNLQAGADGRRSLDIWSAGCSTGEEPYSIAMTVLQHMTEDLSLRIRATDLDSEVLKHAQRGVYKLSEVEALPRSLLSRFFMKGKGKNTGFARLGDDVRSQVNYAQLNLNQDWQLEETFDVIFCRNVMIYFETDLRKMLLQKFYEHLKPGGYLVLGHSESLFGLSDKFRVVGKTIHQRVGS